MSIELVFCIGLALVILAVAGFTIVAKDELCRCRRVCRLRAASIARLDEPFLARRGPDRSGGRRRRDRRAPPGCLRTAAKGSETGRRASARLD